jgi:hypothetical protein
MLVMLAHSRADGIRWNNPAVILGLTSRYDFYPEYGSDIDAGKAAAREMPAIPARMKPVACCSAMPPMVLPPPLSPAHKHHDLNLRPALYHRRAPQIPPHNRAIQLNRHALRLQIQSLYQPVQCSPGRERPRFAIQRNLHLACHFVVSGTRALL